MREDDKRNTREKGAENMPDRATIIMPSSYTGSVEHAAETDRFRNIGEVERWLSLIMGGALAFYGLRRSLGTLALTFGGCALVYRALTGYCPIYQAMGTHTTSRSTYDRHPGESVSR
jgi:hypothetical protein